MEMPSRHTYNNIYSYKACFCQILPSALTYNHKKHIWISKYSGIVNDISAQVRSSEITKIATRDY